MSLPMIVGAVDVHYDDAGGATAALVVCGEPRLAAVTSEHVTRIDRVAPYEPGALYRRELPCIEAVVALGPPLDLLVVDGYATLDAGGGPGSVPGPRTRSGSPSSGSPRPRSAPRRTRSRSAAAPRRDPCT
ncbi:endonuclease V [Cellulomonas sp. SLBN-39]|uniref:endonuclease V n=1 Tax=Cellulomonas sp. SLBN-39 TaxID=2768446 RepID=UPI001C92DA36|nr:endonuclease V [Cellulomonas sp. SLBN-39]